MVETLKVLYRNFILLSALFIFISPITLILSIFYLDVLTPIQWGYVLLADVITVSATDFLSGGLSDKIGRGKTYAISLSLYALTYLVMGLNQTFIWLFIAMIINGLASAQNSGTIDVWFANEYHRLGGKDFRSVMSKVFAMNILVLIPAYIAIPYIAEELGFPTLFFIIAGICFVISLLAVPLMQEPSYNESGEEDDETPSYFSILKNGLTTVFHDANLRNLTFFAVVMAVITGITTEIYFTPEFVNVGLKLSQVGYPRIITAAIGVFISLRYSKIFGSRRIHNQYKMYQQWKLDNPDEEEIPEQFIGMSDDKPKFVSSKRLMIITSIVLPLLFIIFYVLAGFNPSLNLALIFVGFFILYAIVRRIALIAYTSYHNSVIAQTPQFSSSIKSFSSTLNSLFVGIGYMLSTLLIKEVSFSSVALLLAGVAAVGILFALLTEDDE